MEASSSTNTPSFLKPSLLFIPTTVLILVVVGIAKSALGISSGTSPSIFINMFIVGFVTWLLTKGTFKEINREFTLNEKIIFCLLTVVPLTIFEVVIATFFFFQDASLQMVLFVVALAGFLNFCGVWLVISTMFKKIFKDVINAA